jgi:acetolactate synthase-1/2/3 large subunit
VPFAASLTGEIANLLTTMSSYLVTGSWDLQEVERLATAQRDLMRVSSGGLAPSRVVEIVAERFAPVARVTVDAGAHMFPTLALWPVANPNDLLISNGLATMGFALPSAIGAALLDRGRPVVAMTGDGGLLMCVAELKTAAREKLPVRVIVFDDSSLSLIRIKQEERGYQPRGVDFGRTDWRALGAAFGLPAFVADSDTSLQRALTESDQTVGPALIAATIDPSGYPETMRNLRG